MWLKKIGHQSITLKDLMQTGISNGDVASKAIEMDVIILTCDSDFLILKKLLLQKLKVIYIKLHPRKAEAIIQLLEEHLDSCITSLSMPGRITISKDGCVLDS